MRSDDPNLSDSPHYHLWCDHRGHGHGAPCGCMPAMPSKGCEEGRQLWLLALTELAILRGGSG